MVSFKRLAGRAQAEAFANATQAQRDPSALASVGLAIADDLIRTNNVSESLAEFRKALDWAYAKFLANPAEDRRRVESGEMTPEEARARAVMRPRSVYNSAVAFFGLLVLRRVLAESLPAELYQEHFAERLKEMSKACFLGMSALAEATLPEYVKVLTAFADMSKLNPTDPYALLEGVDYNISERLGRAVLVVATRQCYAKYSAYMRHVASQSLYPSDDSFLLALRDIPQFVETGRGTQRLETSTTLLDMEGLYEAGVPRFSGKPVAIAL
jgi:hypothetical protein